jgi:hypothetical protein
MSYIFSFLKRIRNALDKGICSIVEFITGHTDEGPTDDEIEHLIEEADDYGIYRDYYAASARAGDEYVPHADYTGGTRRHDDN